MWVALRPVAYALLWASILVAAGQSFGQTYPTKPIRLVVPAAPGGASEVLGRLLGQKLLEGWGKPVVIDHRPGGQGIIGSQAVASAAPDGYTLLLVATGYVVNPSIYPKLPYDTLRDFTRITVIATSPNVIVVHPSVPAKSITELITLAKTKPGALNYASSGVGGGGHLSVELLKRMADIDLVHIPFKGGGDATTAVVAGQVQVLSTSSGAAMPQARAGRLRILAVTSARRAPELADVPTVAESGLREYSFESWFGLLGPARLPASIVYKLSDEISNILRASDVRAKLTALGFEPVGNTPEEFERMVKAEVPKWAKVVQAARIQLEVPR